jgi:short-subunit dehydrogenase
MQTALITGASAGIGRDLAELCARDGMRVVLVARRKELLDTLAAELQRKHSATIVVLPADLARRDAPAEIAAELVRREIAVDVLVNNAGFAEIGPFHERAPGLIDGMIDVNVRAVVILTRLLLPSMIARKDGKILNVVSTAAFQPGPIMATYYATKAFVLSWSEAISNELAKSGVTVTVLCPGPTDTEFMEVANMTAAKAKNAGWLMPSRDVAVAGYRGMLAGKRLVIPGFANWLIAFSVRFAPRSLVLKVSRKLQEMATK